MYIDITKHAQELDIDFLVIGAMARDLVLVHGFGSKIERGTRDIDFGINVASWDEFNALKDRLLEVGYEPDAKMEQRLHIKERDGLDWEIDIVPFGKIADIQNKIYWPPEQDFVMNVQGLAEAFEDALQIQISKTPETIILVASPAGICLLKLIAWLDRKTELRQKDASDFVYLIETYSKIEEIQHDLYDKGHVEAQGWDETKASAMKLGNDVSEIAYRETKDFLEKELFNNGVKKEQFVRDMKRNTHKSLEQCEEFFSIFKDSFLNGDGFQ